jgi:hypothetical protein
MRNAVTILLAVLCARPVLAADCVPIRVEADPGVTDRWPELPGRVREALEGRDDIDGCGTVRLGATSGTVRVEVLLPDGRSASRSVSRSEDVIPTVEALLLLPHAAAPSRSHDPAPPIERAGPVASPARTVRAEPVLPASVVAATAIATVARTGGLGFELSVVTGARTGGGQASVGVGVLSFLIVGRWLLGFQGRADGYWALSPGGVPGGVLELGLLGGRRFRSGNIGLDLLGGPAAAVQGTATFSAMGPDGQNYRASRSSTMPRLLAGARLNFGMGSVLRTFVGLDAGMGPAGGRDVPGAPRLPPVSVGLTLGATVGTL